MFKMEFCPRCGTHLIYRHSSEKSLFCPKCGYVSKTPEGILLKVNSDPARSYSSSVAVLDRDMLNLRTTSTVRAYCEKCGEDKAETWIMSVGSEGTSSVTFYRCVSCGHAWRETG